MEEGKGEKARERGKQSIRAFRKLHYSYTRHTVINRKGIAGVEGYTIRIRNKSGEQRTNL